MMKRMTKKTTNLRRMRKISKYGLSRIEVICTNGVCFVYILSQYMIYLFLVFSVCFGCDQLFLLTSDFIELLNLSLWTKLPLLLQAMMKSLFSIYVSSLILLPFRVCGEIAGWHYVLSVAFCLCLVHHTLLLFSKFQTDFDL